MIIKMKRISDGKSADVHVDSVIEMIENGGYMPVEFADRIARGDYGQSSDELDPLPVDKKELIALIEAKTGKDIDGRTSEAKVIEMAKELDIEV